MNKINTDQLIAIIGKEKADALFLNPKWIKKQKHYQVMDIRYIVFEKFGRLEDLGDDNYRGDFKLMYKSPHVLQYLPKINRLEGHLNIAGNRLTSLQGCPKEVLEGFNCSDNDLVDLVGGPEIVGLFFVCSDNKLTSLKGSPKEVHGNFECQRNGLTTLEGSPDLVSGDFGCADNELTDLGGISNTIGGDFNGIRNHFRKGLVQRTPDGKTYMTKKKMKIISE